ncbi:hypothetical protein Mapa_003393 [Marchantia paleacea]|nr:hypothetical protein Mapa_003393 [Marchantia paleacea]
MAEEDDDYMSDLTRFIPSEFSAAPHSTGKSLTDRDKQNWKGKRKVKLEQQRKAEEEQRKEGLGAAIPSSNIGFKMLQQMGYTPGAALGKHGQGVLEPVSVDLKRSRTGLGRDVAIKEEQIWKARRAEFESVRQRQVEKELRADFQERRKSSWQSRKIASDYAKAIATLTDLEERLTSFSSPKTHSLSILDKAETETCEEKAEEEEITLEMLQEIFEKLRTKFNYCFFCGVQYASAETLVAECPGLDEEDH